MYIIEKEQFGSSRAVAAATVVVIDDHQLLDLDLVYAMYCTESRNENFLKIS